MKKIIYSIVFLASFGTVVCAQTSQPAPGAQDAKKNDRGAKTSKNSGEATLVPANTETVVNEVKPPTRMAINEKGVPVKAAKDKPKEEKAGAKSAQPAPTDKK
jgi:hypothetical protein